MKQFLRKRLTPVVSFSIAAGLWIVSSVGQSFTYSQMKPLPVDLERTVTTKPAATVLYNPERDCPANAPFSCYITATESHLERKLQTSAREDDDEALLEVFETLQGKGTETLFGDLEPSAQNNPGAIFEVYDSVVLIRHSTYPLLEPISSLAVDAPSLNLELDTGDFTRDGLQYFFPFNTERRSYQYFDIFAQQAWPLDYVREENGHFIFEQKIPAINLIDAMVRSYTHPTDISDEPQDQIDAESLSDSQQQALEALKVRGTVASFYPAEFPHLISTQNFNAAAGALEDTDSDTEDEGTAVDGAAASMALSNTPASESAVATETDGSATLKTDFNAAEDAETSSTENTAAAVPDATNPEQNPNLTPIFLPESLAAQGLSGTEEISISPYYTVTRTIEVEPRSGVIVDQTEDLFFFYAYDDAEATELAASTENQRTILRTTLAWEQATQDAALAQAQPITRTLQTVRIIGFGMNMIALGFLITGFIRITRQPRTSGQIHDTQRIGLE